MNESPHGEARHGKSVRSRGPRRDRRGWNRTSGVRGRRGRQGRPHRRRRQDHRIGRRGDRRQGHAGHPRLRRHPHPLRRPGDLGPADAALLLARGHQRRDGQLRRRIRPLQDQGPRPSDPADGRGGGHSLSSADRRPAVGLGKAIPPISTAFPPAGSTSTSAASFRTQRCASSSWASGAPTASPPPRPTSMP